MRLGVNVTDYIAFVNTERDCELAKEFHKEAAMFRVPMDSFAKLRSKIPSVSAIWVDGLIDGLHQTSPAETYKSYLQQFPRADDLRSPEFHKKPDPAIVQPFVSALLDLCVTANPSYISVPQLPRTNGNERNRINKTFADCTRQWQTASKYSGQLLLPLILTNSEQVKLKSSRSKHIDAANTCRVASNATGVWLVDASLNDQEGAKSLEQFRFPRIVDFQTELNGTLPANALTIAGPYWGMNVVLWARGLVKHPAIGIGNAFQYHISGGRLMPGKTRVALGPLRRWALLNTDLKRWLGESLARLSPQDAAHKYFSEIDRNFSRLLQDGRPQVARFYSLWLQRIAKNAPAGRALALYQDLSSAYVLGRSLRDLPKDEGSARRPERVAGQLMMQCL